MPCLTQILKSWSMESHVLVWYCVYLLLGEFALPKKWHQNSSLDILLSQLFLGGTWNPFRIESMAQCADTFDILTTFKVMIQMMTNLYQNTKLWKFSTNMHYFFKSISVFCCTLSVTGSVMAENSTNCMILWISYILYGIYLWLLNNYAVSTESSLFYGWSGLHYFPLLKPCSLKIIPVIGDQCYNRWLLQGLPQEKQVNIHCWQRWDLVNYWHFNPVVVTIMWYKLAAVGYNWHMLEIGVTRQSGPFHLVRCDRSCPHI